GGGVGRGGWTGRETPSRGRDGYACGPRINASVANATLLPPPPRSPTQTTPRAAPARSIAGAIRGRSVVASNALKPNTTFTPRESAPWTLSAPGVVLAVLGQRDVEDHRPRALSRQLVEEGGEARAARRIEAKILSLRVGARPRGRLQAERDDPELIAERDVEEPVAHPRDAVLEPDVDRVEEVRPGERENDQGNGGNHEE